jgi:hypothetical protein
MAMTETRYRERLGFNWGENPENFRTLTVSRYDNHIWLPIPWNNEGADPQNQHYVNPTTGAGGWSVLHGPCDYTIVGHARLLSVQPGCSTHIQIRHALETDTNTPTWLGEAWEWFAGPFESSHTHVDGTWMGHLNAGEVAQVALDYWNAGPDLPQAQVTCQLAGASLDIEYYRPEGV